MTIEEVLAATSPGQEHLAAFLDQRLNQITPQLAGQAREAFEEAALRRDGDSALLGAQAARELYRRLGEPEQVLRNDIDLYAVVYSGKDSLEFYANLRPKFQELAQQADALNRPDMTLDALTLAAECSLHALMLVPNNADWFNAALADTVAATSRATAAGSQHAFERLVYLVAQVASSSFDRTLTDDQASYVRALADWARASVPVNFSFSLDSRIDVQIAGQLSALTQRY